MQSRRRSLTEAITNTVVGFIISLLIQMLIYPMMDIPVRFEQNLIITTIFTLASIGRGYVLRRLFNLLK